MTQMLQAEFDIYKVDDYPRCESYQMCSSFKHEWKINFQKEGRIFIDKKIIF